MGIRAPACHHSRGLAPPHGRQLPGQPSHIGGMDDQRRTNIKRGSSWHRASGQTSNISPVRVAAPHRLMEGEITSYGHPPICRSSPAASGTASSRIARSIPGSPANGGGGSTASSRGWGHSSVRRWRFPKNTALRGELMGKSANPGAFACCSAILARPPWSRLQLEDPRPLALTV